MHVLRLVLAYLDNSCPILGEVVIVGPADIVRVVVPCNMWVGSVDPDQINGIRDRNL